MAKGRVALGRGLNALIPNNTNNNNSYADNDEIETPSVELSSAPSNNGDNTLEDSNPATNDAPVSEKIENKGSEPRRVGLSWVDITAIAPNPYQPRKYIDPQVLNELADSIKELGIIQPPVVSHNPDFDEKVLNQVLQEGDNATDKVDDDGKNRRARYLLIAGERRWQASKLAGLTTIPVVIKETTPLQMLEMALVENIQRADLNPLEEAMAYRQLSAEFKMTQREIAQRVGKSREAVANALRLLDMPKELYKQLNQGNITEGHARALLTVEHQTYQLRLLNEVLTNELSVRKTEELARRYNAIAATKEALDEIVAEEKAKRFADRETSQLEDQLRLALGTKVELQRSKKGGKITIQFFSNEELESVYRKIVGDFEI